MCCFARWSQPQKLPNILRASGSVAGRFWKQLLQRRVVQLVGGDDVIQVLQVALLVTHEVRDSGPGECGHLPQPLHVFK